MTGPFGTEASLGDLVDIRHGFAFEGQFFRTDPVGDVLLTPGNFKMGGGFSSENLKYYVGPVPEEFVLREGDLIVTMTDLSKGTATLGYPALLPAISPWRWLHNQRLGKVVIKRKDQLDRRFLYYLLCSPDYRQEVLAGATGTTVKHTSPGRIKAFRFVLPPISQQRAIGSTLGALDDKAELNRRMNQTLQGIAEVRFDALHRDRTDLREVRFEDLAERVVDRAHDDWTTDPLIDLGRVPEHSLSVWEWGLGGELSTSVTRFRALDVLFGAVRPYFHKVAIAPLDGVTNTSVFVLRARGSSDWPYVALRAFSRRTVGFASRVSAGTKMPVVRWRDLADMEVAVPSAAIRKRFGDETNSLLWALVSNVREANLLARIRDALLPRLLSTPLES